MFQFDTKKRKLKKKENQAKITYPTNLRPAIGQPCSVNLAKNLSVYFLITSLIFR